MKERCTARRYNFLLPVSVRVHVENEAVSRIGKTRDISIQGIHFSIDGELMAGAELDLTMTLPAEATGVTEVFIRTTGRVLWVDKRSGNVGQPMSVSAKFGLYEILPNKAAIT